MNIGIDLRQLVIGAGGGILQLVKGVCEHMFQQYPEHQFLVFCTPFNRSLLNYEAKHVKYFSLPVSTFFNELDCIAKKESLHVLFRTYPVEDALQFPLYKQIFLIPDNQHETFPEFFSPKVLRARRAAFSRALAGAGAVGTISEFAKNALLDFHETRCKDMFLMPPSLQDVHKNEMDKVELSDSEWTLIPQNDYFLYPANLWKHKNHYLLLQAFQLFRENGRRSDISLILTGHPTGWSELSREFKDLPVSHLGFVRPELLRVLLERAVALVFFSLYEGFGMPLLEAFHAGIPVICSNTTSLPEVGGDAVLTCDPTDVDAIVALMNRISVDNELREKMIQSGKERLNVYSWDKSAYNLIAACERVMNANKQCTIENIKSQDPLPLVSIVTPSFNQGEFIKQTIDSVLMQSYPKIEYMVIDGGSNDETIEILQSYGDRIKWVSEADRGQTHAINKGMSQMNGEIRAYLNSDDILAPGAVDKVVNFFRHNPDCDMVYGNADYIDKGDQVIGSYNTAEFSFDRLFQDCMLCQPATFWRQRIAEKVGLFDEQLNYAMDYDYWLRIAKSGGSICFLPEKLACSRLYKETKTLSARSKIYKEIFNICRKHAGYTHQNYYIGYWHHLINETDGVHSRALRLIPKSHAFLGRMHFILSHRDKNSIRRGAGYLVRKVKRRIAFFRMGSLTIIKATIKKVTLGILAERKKNLVVGFGTDNWLEPMVTIPPMRRVPGHLLHIAGISPIDLIMRISADDKEIHSYKYKAKKYKKISFPADAVSNKQITINFSGYIEDDNRRRLAFLLQDTNVFAESDI